MRRNHRAEAPRPGGVGAEGSAPLHFRFRGAVHGGKAEAIRVVCGSGRLAGGVEPQRCSHVDRSAH